uniref:Putative secreted protein n=1 Tax=Amblyomma cajennense TaxID=34607 RepID=A0A023FDK9_AMBCJ
MRYARKHFMLTLLSVTGEAVVFFFLFPACYADLCLQKYLREELVTTQTSLHDGGLKQRSSSWFRLRQHGALPFKKCYSIVGYGKASVML